MVIAFHAWGYNLPPPAPYSLLSAFFFVKSCWNAIEIYRWWYGALVCSICWNFNWFNSNENQFVIDYWFTELSIVFRKRIWWVSAKVRGFSHILEARIICQKRWQLRYLHRPWDSFYILSKANEVGYQITKKPCFDSNHLLFTLAW